MNNDYDAGIRLLADNVDGLRAGRPCLLAGGPRTAKTTFALQFIYQGLKEGKRCVWVSTQAPSRVVAHADGMGMDLAPYIKDGTLLLYEVAGEGSFSPAELFSELESILDEAPVSRLVFEGLAQLPGVSGTGESLAESVSAFLRKAEQKKTTAWITVDPSVASAPLKSALENGAGGSFLLKTTGDEQVKTLSVEALAGSEAAGKEFQFTVEAGRGIVEKARVSGIKFPRSEEH